MLQCAVLYVLLRKQFTRSQHLMGKCTGIGHKCLEFLEVNEKNTYEANFFLRFIGLFPLFVHANGANPLCEPSILFMVTNLDSNSITDIDINSIDNNAAGSWKGLV